MDFKKCVATVQIAAFFVLSDVFASSIDLVMVSMVEDHAMAGCGMEANITRKAFLQP